jgi:hypothetical protein
MKSMKTTRPKKEADNRQTRTCKGCYEDFKTRVRAKYCGKCNNWGNKNGRGALLLKHNLEKCEDQDRKDKILQALAVESSRRIQLPLRLQTTLKSRSPSCGPG